MSSGADLDNWLETARACKCLDHADMKKLCNMVKCILLEESNVVPVQAPVNICGDIHGQFYDLLELFKQSGDLPDKNYLFLGDIVDRGYHSLETLTLLMILKVKYSHKVTILRGNHETREISQAYGFYDECQRKYPVPHGSSVWKWCMEVCDFLPIGAIVNDEIFCVHGGLAPEIRTLDQIRIIQRNVESTMTPNRQTALTDLMWSDPEEGLEGWAMNPRGAGWLFGHRVVDEFNQINGIQLIARAHQLVMEGYNFMFPNKNLITVWSAPNYCYRCGNLASVMELDENMKQTFKVFSAVEDQIRTAPEKAEALYFM